MKEIIRILDSCNQRPSLDQLNHILQLRNAVAGAKSSRVFNDDEILTRFKEFEKLRLQSQ
jgi:hypothetical protein